MTGRWAALFIGFLALWATISCSSPAEPVDDWVCVDEEPAYFVRNVRGKYVLIWHCPSAAGTEHEWRTGDEYDTPAGPVVK